MTRKENPRAATLGLLAFVIVACSRHAQAIAPDYEVDFSCRTPPEETVIEHFASAWGFRPFNEEGARRQREKGFFPLEIDSYDARKRMLDLIGLREPPSHGNAVRYRLTILGSPPTDHDRALESAALGLVRDGLHCQVASVETFVNGAEARTMFERIFKDEQRRIAEFTRTRRMP